MSIFEVSARKDGKYYKPHKYIDYSKREALYLYRKMHNLRYARNVTIVKIV